MDKTTKDWIAAQKSAGFTHDTENCLACNMWAWSDEDVRPPQNHLWKKTP
jgi:hypothetical protein